MWLPGAGAGRRKKRKMKYLKIELLYNGTLQITEIEDAVWLDQFYSGGNAIKGTECFVQDKKESIKKLINKRLKEVNQEYKKILNEKQRLEILLAKQI